MNAPLPATANGYSAATLDKAALHYRRFCETVGINLGREDTADTPQRVAKLFLKEFTAGQRCQDFNFTTFKAVGKDLVSVCGIRFDSICAHHHLPITGYAHFCYLPDKLIAGLSKIPRTIKWFASQPTVQEELTHTMLDALVSRLHPHFAAMTITATHACMACRGVKDYEARMTTTAIWTKRKSIKTYHHTHDEFQRAIDLWYSSRGVL